MRRANWLLLSLLIPTASAIGIAYATRNVNVGLFEPANAAVTLLAKGYIGDPFGLPSGPTAHVSPLPVLFLSVIIRLFGAYNDAARVAIALVNGAVYVACCLLSLRVLTRLGVHRSAVWMAAAITILVPLRLYDFQVLYRQWDLAWVNLLLLGGFDIYLRSRNSSVAGQWRGVTGLGVLAGLAALTSPGAMLGIIALAALLAFHQPNWRTALTMPLWAIVLCAAFIAPWAWRNHVALGSAVPLRSSFGLALSAGNWDGAMGTLTNPDYPPFPDRLFAEPAAIADMVAVGEAAHMAALGQKAKAWILDHPGRFAELTVRRIWLSFVPEVDRSVWIPAKLEIPRMLLLYLVGLGTPLALGIVLIARRDILAWLSVTILPMAAYLITYVDDRYVSQQFFPRVCLVAFGFHLARERWIRCARPGKDAILDKALPN